MNKKHLIIVFIIGLINTPIPVLATCGEYCEDIAPAVRIVKYGMIPLFQIIIPIALIMMGMIDLSKAMISDKEAEIKKSQAMFIRRCIYGLAVFFVMTIVTLVMSLFSTTGVDKDVEGTEDWWKCYNSVDECNDNEEELEESDKPEEEIIIIDN